jgi:hypothetical protein
MHPLSSRCLQLSWSLLRDFHGIIGVVTGGSTVMRDIIITSVVLVIAMTVVVVSKLAGRGTAKIHM